MAYENWILSQHASTYIATIHRPWALNALNRHALEELQTLLTQVNQDHSVKALVLTGSGEKSFVAGADIQEMKQYTPIEAQAFSAFGHHVLDSVGQMRIPVIAAVNGYALGGGLELALACDLIYASQNASFGLVETKLGLIPGFGGIARLCNRVGEAYAKEWLFTANTISAQEALQVGLINAIANGSVVDAALSLCKRMDERGHYAIQTIKQVLWKWKEAPLQTAHALEQMAFGLVFSSKDKQEGIQAFLDKRPPHFEGI